MKRSEALTPLAREHHGALVLARRLQRASPDDAGLLADLRVAWSTLLEPHFRCEEQGLLPALRAAGELQLVERTLAEHQQLRSLMEDIEAGDRAAQRRFGELLHEHVRFEDRQLFERAEALYAEHELARLVQAP
ncbi:MAG: hemerythrin domain-containing protein [Proteobacteria bacterium]|nr:hemerythrin domain-containing protein [Pseudomonadota bacterium]MBK8958334.1 hemerythrin domain-containing protein [Pseudomonadota bacterium]